MKLLLQIFLFFFTWFSSSATTVFAKVALPTYEFSFPKTAYVKQASEVNISVSNFARNGLSEIKQVHPEIKTFSINLNDFCFSADNENCIVFTSVKSFSKSQLKAITLYPPDQLQNLFPGSLEV